jgi:hypothetical protein
VVLQRSTVGERVDAVGETGHDHPGRLREPGLADRVKAATHEQQWRWLMDQPQPRRVLLVEEADEMHPGGGVPFELLTGGL